MMIACSDGMHRAIFMDGRSLEPDPNPTWMGYSVGHWEGDEIAHPRWIRSEEHKSELQSHRDLHSFPTLRSSDVIFMYGRSLEPDPNPTWMGYSVGHWEGDEIAHPRWI